MTDKERDSCINTVNTLRRLALNIHGVIDVIDNENCDKIINMLKQTTEDKSQGEWRHYEGMLFCPNCKAEFYDEIMEYCNDEPPKHCPDCGANLMGKEQE